MNLHELSKQRLQNYHKKATKDTDHRRSVSNAAVTAHAGARDAHGDPKHPEVRHYTDQIHKANHKVSKREKGLRRSQYLLTKKAGETSMNDRVAKLKSAGRAVAKKVGTTTASVAKRVAKGVIRHAAAGAASGIQKARLKAGLTEGTLNELSAKTLLPYIAKAGPKLKAHKTVHNKITQGADAVKGTAAQDAVRKWADEESTKIHKRTKGLARAFTKLKEETLSELSTKTLTSYTKKAGKSMGRNLAHADSHEDKAMSTDGMKYPERQAAHNAKARKFFLKANKRANGILKVKDRLKKE